MKTVRPSALAVAYNKFAKAVAEMRAISSKPLPPGKLSDPLFDRAVGKASKLAWRVVELPADTVEDMLLKIRVAIWAEQAGDLDSLDNWQPSPGIRRHGEEMVALTTLRDDLKRMLAFGREKSIGAEHPAFRLRKSDETGLLPAKR